MALLRGGPSQTLLLTAFVKISGVELFRFDISKRHIAHMGFIRHKKVRVLHFRTTLLAYVGPLC